MSVGESVVSCVLWLLQSVACKLLRCTGRVPRHVAFIMDGNRRHAHGDKHTGHSQGYAKMIQVVKWCMELGVPHISVYAFSIDNFKRSEAEVSFLMGLAEEKYADLMQGNSFASRNGLEVRVLGDLTLTPTPVREAADSLMRASRALPCKRGVLNIMFSYTSTYEMAHVVACNSYQRCREPNGQQRCQCEFDRLPSGTRAIDTRKHWLTAGSPDVELVMRTSGETRLSDFMLWQCRNALIIWIDEFWPAFSLGAFAQAIRRYQDSVRHLDSIRDVHGW